MADWSVALFGHQKPRYYINELSTGKTIHTSYEPLADIGDAWMDGPYLVFLKTMFEIDEDIDLDRRAAPGDIVDFKPYSDRHIWSPIEHTRFFIVTIQGVSHDQMRALCEKEWDTFTYPDPKPFKSLSFGKWQGEVEKRIDLKGGHGHGRWRNKPTWKKAIEYETFMKAKRNFCAFPQVYRRKHRMQIRLDDLKAAGVDTMKMLNTRQLYKRDVAFNGIGDATDKLRGRKTNGSDRLRKIRPVWHF